MRHTSATTESDVSEFPAYHAPILPDGYRVAFPQGYLHMCYSNCCDSQNNDIIDRFFLLEPLKVE